jgi:hypothetical protein
VSLVERNGEVRSVHVANVTAKTLRPVLVTLASCKSTLMTDESTVYPKVGGEFANHMAVNHSANEYARLGGFVHTNTVEGYFSILKRGIYGTYHHVSEEHLHRYLVERTISWLNRCRRLAKDFEATLASATAFLYAASVMLLTRRLARCA